MRLGTPKHTLSASSFDWLRGLSSSIRLQAETWCVMYTVEYIFIHDYDTFSAVTRVDLFIISVEDFNVTAQLARYRHAMRHAL